MIGNVWLQRNLCLGWLLEEAGKNVTLIFVTFNSSWWNHELLRVARFFLEHDTNTGKNVTKEYKMYHLVIKCPKFP
jgi:hypothetical protein